MLLLPAGEFYEEGQAASAAYRAGQQQQQQQQQQGDVEAPPNAPAPASPQQPATSWEALQQRVTTPLVAVQASLQRDAVVWQRGLLATPPIVRLMLRSEFRVRPAQPGDASNARRRQSCWRSWHCSAGH
jgi:hypothetical protein